MKRNFKKILLLALILCLAMSNTLSIQVQAAKADGSKERPYSAYKSRVVDIYGARYYGKAKIKLIGYKDGNKALRYLKKNGVKKKPKSSKEYVYLKFKIEYIYGEELIPADLIITPYSSLFNSECNNQLKAKTVKCKDGIPDLAEALMYPGKSVICKQAILINSENTPITYMVYGYDDNGDPTETWFKTEKWGERLNEENN